MRAAFYDHKGQASEVLKIAEIERPEPCAGEVLIRLYTSGVVPGDTKKRAGAFSLKMPFPRIIPHSDGAGVIEAVGEGVPKERIGERVFTYNAQIGRAFGTAAQYITIESERAVHLPANIDFVEGGTIGLSGVTAHRCVYVGGDVRGKTVLVSGGAGRVGILAAQIAAWAGARVIATVGRDQDIELLKQHDIDEVLNFRMEDDLPKRILDMTDGKGVDHIVEVVFDRNLDLALHVLKIGGSISTYAGADGAPILPFWELIFKNVSVHFVGFDDIPKPAVEHALRDMRSCMSEERLRHPIAAERPLEAIADAHSLIETGVMGSVVLLID